MVHVIKPTDPPPTRELFSGLDHAALVARYGIGVERFDRRVFELDNSQLDSAFRPESGVGRWPVRVLLGHLADAEVAFVHRLRRVVAEDGPVFALWDENAFIDRGLYGREGRGEAHPVGASVAVVHTLRRWTTPWLETLEPADWARKAMHPERGEQSTRLILEYATWHVEHHAWFLNAKIQRFLGASAE